MVDRIRALLREEVVDPTLYRAIVASGWYPVSWYRELHRAAEEAMPQERDLAKRLGEEAMKLDLSRVYAFILRVLGPDRTFRHAERALSTYWEGARVSILDRGDEWISARFHEMPGLDERLWQDVLGGTRVVVSRSVGEEVTITILSGGRTGADYLELEVRWPPD